MPATSRPRRPDQSLPLPPDRGDRLPEGHPAYPVGDPVEGLDSSAFHARCEGDSRRKSPYERACRRAGRRVRPARVLRNEADRETLGVDGCVALGRAGRRDRAPIRAFRGCRAAVPRPKVRHRIREDLVPVAPGDSPGLPSSCGAGF